MKKILGIPKRYKYSNPKKSGPSVWPFSIQEHNADRAGKHYDLRLGKKGLSWAIRNWPEPGQKSLAKQTDDHSLDYYNFEGEIKSGYGKGHVKLLDSGETDILKSSPDKISFLMRDRYLPKRYSLLRTNERDWLLINHTPEVEKRKEIPKTKDKYKKLKSLDKALRDPNIIFSPKYDGAANIIVLRNNKHPEVFSHRRGKTGLIDHSYKLNFDKYLSKTRSSKPTVLWAETLAMDKTGKPKHVSETAGALNAALKRTRFGDDKFKNIAYNISMFKGKDVSKLPFEKKISLLKEVVKDNKFLDLPEMQFTEKDKSNLLKSIKSNKHGMTSEGIIAFNLKNPIPEKSKFDKEYNVYIRSIKPGKGKFSKSGGGIEFSWTKDGPIIGTIGGGFTEYQRQDLYNNPSTYIGKRAIVKAHEQFKSTRLRMPIFVNWYDHTWPTT
jgi:hypothetical protein